MSWVHQGGPDWIKGAGRRAGMCRQHPSPQTTHLDIGYLPSLAMPPLKLLFLLASNSVRLFSAPFLLEMPPNLVFYDLLQRSLLLASSLNSGLTPLPE